ncbi:hypothetical protein WN944_006553 [Citrus x changshan-huyou]|uniref:Inhibitor I9 domain-containing protein n=1 Tax=Citrus x changshan-huyou TaxID=2935761 RepID=A0AAP0QTL3_9ROSI
MGGTFKPVPQPRLEVPARTGRHRFSQQMRLPCDSNWGANPVKLLKGTPLSYKRSFSGFAAKLTDHERQKLASMEDVVSVFPGRTLQLYTTRSWDFMGFNQSISGKYGIESAIIVGVTDSGICPESER